MARNREEVVCRCELLLNQSWSNYQVVSQKQAAVDSEHPCQRPLLHSMIFHPAIVYSWEPYSHEVESDVKTIRRLGNQNNNLQWTSITSRTCKTNPFSSPWTPAALRAVKERNGLAAMFSSLPCSRSTIIPACEPVPKELLPSNRLKFCWSCGIGRDVDSSVFRLNKGCSTCGLCLIDPQPWRLEWSWLVVPWALWDAAREAW